ncbi:HAD-IA family hydrolase [bacterium]|nr:HAD-IA family hydrolase [bacterium]
MPLPDDIQWIFFDLDETLWDHSSASKFALRAACEKHGCDFDEFMPIFHEANRALWEQLAHGSIDVATLRIQRFRDTLREILANGEVGRPDQMSEDYLSIYLSRESELPGASEVLREAARIGRVAVLTNAPHETQDIKLSHLDARHCVEWMLTIDETQCLKPRPEFFEMAEKRAGHPQPEQILYVGDSWSSDIQPSHERGWHCVWISRGHDLPEELDRLLVVPTIADLLPHLQQWQRTQ